jgi:D-alanyl-D-alanine carboxypeptidase
MSMGWNLMKYQRLNADGTALEPSPIDEAIDAHVTKALCPMLEDEGAGAGARDGSGSGAGLKSRLAAGDAGRILQDGILPDGILQDGLLGRTLP